MKKTDDFASFTDAAACMVNTYGGNMESEEEVDAVLYNVPQKQDKR